MIEPTVETIREENAPETTLGSIFGQPDETGAIHESCNKASMTSFLPNDIQKLQLNMSDKVRRISSKKITASASAVNRQVSNISQHGQRVCRQWSLSQNQSCVDPGRPSNASLGVKRSLTRKPSEALGEFLLDMCAQNQTLARKSNISLKPNKKVNL